MIYLHAHNCLNPTNEVMETPMQLHTHNPDTPCSRRYAQHESGDRHTLNTEEMQAPAVRFAPGVPTSEGIMTWKFFSTTLSANSTTFL